MYIYVVVVVVVVYIRFCAAKEAFPRLWNERCHFPETDGPPNRKKSKLFPLILKWLPFSDNFYNFFSCFGKNFSNRFESWWRHRLIEKFVNQTNISLARATPPGVDKDIYIVDLFLYIGEQYTFAIPGPNPIKIFSALIYANLIF